MCSTKSNFGAVFEEVFRRPSGYAKGQLIPGDLVLAEEACPEDPLNSRRFEIGREDIELAVTCGTVFEATKLPLRRWFLVMHLMTEAKRNVSALELQRHLEARYKAA